jgi:hypothetical protein
VVGLAGRRAVLDTCAIIHLRKSAENMSLGQSLYQYAGGKDNLKEQRVGNKLRYWLHVKVNNDWDVCITEAAIMESDAEMKRAINKATVHVKKRRATVKALLLNRPHLRKLYKSSRNCANCSEEGMKRIKEEVRNAYHNWENDDKRDCVTKYGFRNKRYFPEGQDIRRLSEAIANKNGNKRDVFFLTNDSHFLCHIQSIKNEFEITVLDYREF